MKRPNESELLYVEIPEELDAAILRGVQNGKRIMNRKKYVQRTVAGAAAVFAIFVGSINTSPALAANLEDLAVLGSLVRVFRWNTPEAEGGQTDVTAKAAVSFQSGADSEQLTLTFDAANAAAYKASLTHFPETVTLTLPSTQEVGVLEEVNPARENSRFIKSVYVLDRADGASQVQIEFDVTADVAVEEYKDPGSIVVRLKEGEFVGQNVYSLRTLSMDQDALTKMQKDFPDARILRDDGEGWLLEIGQYDSEQTAQDTVTLDGLTDLLGKTDAELTETLGEGTENWTSDKLFFIGRTYAVTLEDSAATLSSSAQDDEARTVQSLSVWLSDGSAEVSEETVDGWIDTLTAYIGAEAEVSGPSEGGAQTWHWSRDSVYYDLQLLAQILTLSIQAVTGGELQ